ncbi:sugar kinase [Pelosinus sp. sgz500959]|uniref:sugar kinase n=1 Tax=Pelosinus sp. sgz500959 TaxID=3242472 RepID=UPI00366B533A
MSCVLTIGEILVEIMAKHHGQKFNVQGEFVGPFPSGAPAIFIDQVARLGTDCKIIASVGQDDFGKLNIDRLTSDGVDTNSIKVHSEFTTGVAFVTYNEDGGRSFIYHMPHSAAGHLAIEHIKEEYFHDCKFLHIMGCSLFNENSRQAILKGVEIAQQKGVRISFDPNARKEILNNEKIKDAIYYIVEKCNIFLPSGDELQLLTGIGNEIEAAQYLIKGGVEIVLVKKGSAGSTLYTQKEIIDCKAYQVDEVDPTGAGDCFDGAFIACLEKGMDVKDAQQFATAAGARAVTKKGPMEGTSTYREIVDFMKGNKL